MGKPYQKSRAIKYYPYAFRYKIKLFFETTSNIKYFVSSYVILLLKNISFVLIITYLEYYIIYCYNVNLHIKKSLLPTT